MAREDRYSHKSNDKGDTSMSQKGNESKAGKTAADSNPPVKSDGPENSGPPAGESSMFGLHSRERADMHTRQEDETKMMHTKHQKEHTALNERQMKEIGGPEIAETA